MWEPDQLTLVQWLGNWVIRVSCPTEMIPLLVATAPRATEAHLPRCSTGICGSFHVGNVAAVQNSLTLPSAKVKNVQSYTPHQQAFYCVMCNKAQWQFYLNRYSLTKSICVPKHIPQLIQLQCMAHFCKSLQQCNNWTNIQWRVNVHELQCYGL